MASRNANRLSFLTTFGLVFLAIVGLFAADTFLARMERSESAVEAARLFAEARGLIQRGDNVDAIERIGDALSIERTNRLYRQTLAQTQLAAGKAADAEATLNELLEGDPTDGPANLIMGRVLAKESRFPEAISYFHRAIYGRWDADTAQNRLRARFELIDLLALRDSKEDLMAELLPVQDQIPRDLQTRARMGSLFLRAGSPARAADIFRGIVQEAPARAEGYAGLGDAEFAQANYRAAEGDFETALRLSPGDAAVRERLELSGKLLALDPTLRGLTPAERLTRSRRLVELVRDEVRQCAAPDLNKRAAGQVTQVNPELNSELNPERNLDLAEDLWQARARECKSQPPADDPVALVMARLAR
jgi:tetratricopeptide (TPR) repeat protein